MSRILTPNSPQAQQLAMQAQLQAAQREQQLMLVKANMVGQVLASLAAIEVQSAQMNLDHEGGELKLDPAATAKLALHYADHAMVAMGLAKWNAGEGA